MTREEFDELVKDNSKELTAEEYYEVMSFLIGDILPVIKYGEEYNSLVEKVYAITPRRNVIKGSRQGFTRARNSMGCSENWYDPDYAIANTFTDEQIDNFSDETLEALLTLGQSLSEAFY